MWIAARLTRQHNIVTDSLQVLIQNKKKGAGSSCPFFSVQSRRISHVYRLMPISDKGAELLLKSWHMIQSARNNSKLFFTFAFINMTSPALSAENLLRCVFALMDRIFNLHYERKNRDRGCRIISINLYCFLYISGFAFDINLHTDFPLTLRLQTARTSHRCSTASGRGYFFNDERLITGIAEFEDVFDLIILSDFSEIMPHLIKMYGRLCKGKSREIKKYKDR